MVLEKEDDNDDLLHSGRHRCRRAVRTWSVPRITWSRNLCTTNPTAVAGVWVNDHQCPAVDNTIKIDCSHLQYLRKYKDQHINSGTPQQFDSQIIVAGRVFPKGCIKSLHSPRIGLVSSPNESLSSGTSSDALYPQHHLLRCSSCLITSRHPLSRGGSCSSGGFCRHRHLRLLLGWLAVIAVTLDYFYLASSSCDIYFLGINRSSPFLPRRWASWFKAKMRKYRKTNVSHSRPSEFVDV